MPKRTLQGVVVSDKQAKTVVVRVDRRFTHPIYKKTIRRSKNYHAHDENNEFKPGDQVWIEESKPISKMTRPGLTRATHSSGVPLPEPIRTSAGFFDTGTSGKMRIQTRPARFMWRVSARRAASIWRAVIRSGAIAFRPNWPNDNVAPEVAVP